MTTGTEYLDDVRAARHLRTALERADRYPRLVRLGFEVPDLAHELYIANYELAVRFGEPVVAAFVHTGPIPCCRYGIAKIKATAMGVKLPRPSKALSVLLGSQCSKCSAHDNEMRADALERRAAKVPPPSGFKARRAVVASAWRGSGICRCGSTVAHASTDACKGRGGLYASGEIRRTVRCIAGTDGAGPCNCELCRQDRARGRRRR